MQDSLELRGGEQKNSRRSHLSRAGKPVFIFFACRDKFATKYAKDTRAKEPDDGAKKQYVYKFAQKAMLRVYMMRIDYREAIRTYNEDRGDNIKKPYIRLLLRTAGALLVSVTFFMTKSKFY